MIDFCIHCHLTDEQADKLFGLLEIHHGEDAARAATALLLSTGPIEKIRSSNAWLVAGQLRNMFVDHLQEALETSVESQVECIITKDEADDHGNEHGQGESSLLH